MAENTGNTFQLVHDPERLLDIVKLRLPRCTNVYNMIKYFNLFPESLSFYSLGSENDETKCWIFGKFERDELKNVYVVSNPNNLTHISSNIEEAFNSLPPDIMTWDHEFEFNGLERPVSRLVSDISLSHGNATRTMPVEFFVLSRDEVAKKPLSTVIDPSNPVELKSLNTEAGFQFWKEILKILSLPATPPEAKREHIEKCVSIGAYINDDLVVSNALFNPTGHIGLATFEAHQRKGYARLCYQALVNKLVQETTFIPCSYVYVQNKGSIQLHVKAIQGYDVPRGLIVDFVEYVPE